MATLPREVLKWVQSLDLTYQVRTPKWDLSNGYLVAEIFSWYYPQEIYMHMYNNGTSLDSKIKNWGPIRVFFKRHRFDIPEELIEGTIHCKEGAAVLLIEKLFQLLTNRFVRKTSPEFDIDFTDSAYQAKLPMHARSTAAQAVKNNLKSSELQADPSHILGQQKAHAIIANHIDFRNRERLDNPERFDRKPTLGELSIRQAPLPAKPESMTEEESEVQISPKENIDPSNASQIRSGSQVQFKEVEVKQLNRAEQQRHLKA